MNDAHVRDNCQAMIADYPQGALKLYKKQDIRLSGRQSEFCILAGY